jgi:hypothetical protein
VKVRIRVACEGERCEARLADSDAELFPEFTDERVFWALARLDLAAGKFPQAGHRTPCRPLCDEHAAVHVDKRTGSNQN